MPQWNGVKDEKVVHAMQPCNGAYMQHYLSCTSSGMNHTHTHTRTHTHAHQDTRTHAHKHTHTRTHARPTGRRLGAGAVEREVCPADDETINLARACSLRWGEVCALASRIVRSSVSLAVARFDATGGLCLGGYAWHAVLKPCWL
jgi:ABC-type Zn2+ transport system substrate-binding protein/surface adhesin